MNRQLTGHDLNEAFAALGELLEARGHHYEVVLVGGGNLLLRGVIDRPTKDADLLGARLPTGQVVPLRKLPGPLAIAIRDVARAYGLAGDWLNLGPASLLDLGLPPGFEARLEPLRMGGLVVWFAARYDLICFKLYAAVDHWPTRDRHIRDLSAMTPDPDDLLAAASWARTHDPSPGFRSHVIAVLRYLGIGDADVRLG